MGRKEEEEEGNILGGENGGVSVCDPLPFPSFLDVHE